MQSQPRVIQHSSITLYEDKVVRKARTRLQSDEDMVLVIARVERRLSTGEDSISVELSGYNQRSSKPIQAPKFEINLSGPYWSHYVDEQGLKLTISVTDVNRREKEKHVFKMGCREQLAAWAAELIQATTCEPEKSLQRCFHIVIPAYKGGLIQAPEFQRHAVLQAHHPTDNQLVVRDPLNLSDVRCWDLSQLEDFSFDYFPALRLNLHLCDEKSLLPGKGDYILFLSKEIMQHCLSFLQLFLESKLPRLHAKLRKSEFQSETPHGTIITAVTYRVRSASASAVKRSQSVNFVDMPMPMPRPVWSDSGPPTPYAIAELFPSSTKPEKYGSLISPDLVRRKLNPNTKPKPESFVLKNFPPSLVLEEFPPPPPPVVIAKPKPKSVVLQNFPSSLVLEEFPPPPPPVGIGEVLFPPPSDMIRPGVAVKSQDSVDYVEMSPAQFLPAIPVTVECEVFSSSSDTESYVSADQWVDPELTSLDDNDNGGPSTGNEEDFSIPLGAHDYENIK